MSDKKYNSIVYPAEHLICNWIESDISDKQVKNSADRITEFSMRVTAIKDGNAYIRDSINDRITEDTVMIPIKIFKEDDVYGIDWCLQSPVKEIYYDAIPRWWPKEWLTTPSGELAETVIINLGTIKRMLVPEIEISCRLSDKQTDNSVQNIAFCELYAMADDEEKSQQITEAPEEVGAKVEENMKTTFFNKKSDEKDNVVVESDKNEDKNVLEGKIMEEQIEEVVEVKTSKKPFFIGMGVGAIVGAGLATGVIVLGNKKFGWFSDKEEPESPTVTE
jgi:hypothetical protein